MIRASNDSNGVSVLSYLCMSTSSLISEWLMIYIFFNFMYYSSIYLVFNCIFSNETGLTMNST